MPARRRLPTACAPRAARHAASEQRPRARSEPQHALLSARAARAGPPPRTKWTRRVPHPVPIGHAASLTPYQSDTPRPSARHSTPGRAGPRTQSTTWARDRRRGRGRVRGAATSVPRGSSLRRARHGEGGGGAGAALAVGSGGASSSAPRLTNHESLDISWYLTMK